MKKVKEQTNKGEEGPYMEFVEENCVGGAVASRFCRLPELFLCWVSVHGTQSEKAVWGRQQAERALLFLNIYLTT